MTQEKIISADSHLVEPPTLWVDRLDRKYRDKAPRVVDGPPGSGPVFRALGAPDLAVAPFYALGANGMDLVEAHKRGYEAARPGCWEPEARIRDMDTDGIDAEVLYTTLAFTIYAMDDLELKLACFRTYNDWLLDLCSAAPKRLIPVALVSLEDPNEGIKELNRMVKRGVKTVMSWSAAPEERLYHTGHYDPFFAAAQDAGVSISMHEITARRPNASAPPDRSTIDGEVKFMDAVSWNFIREMQGTISSLLFGGVLERFPRLKWTSVELDVGWVPYMAFRYDIRWEKFNSMSKFKLPKPPSEYLRDQFFFTFQWDPVGPRLYNTFGEDNFLWASDYPHSACTWPNSLKVIEKLFDGLPDRVRRKMVWENGAKLYGLS